MKTIQRIISFILAFCLVLPMLPATGWAEEIVKETAQELVTVTIPMEVTDSIEEELPTEQEENLPESHSEAAEASNVTASGICGDNLTWNLTNGELTINGTGDMFDYDAMCAPWHEHNAEIQTVTILGGVSRIGDYAFFECTNLTKAMIPDSVVSIGEQSFSCCYNLNNILLPNSISLIGYYAFWRCASLKEITIPDGLSEINNGVFSDCDGLSKITLKTGITRIGEFAFADCNGLKEIVIPNTVQKIGECVFEACDNLQEICFLGTESEFMRIDGHDYLGWFHIRYDVGEGTPDKDEPAHNVTYLDEMEITASDRYTDNQGDSFIDKIGTRNSKTDIYGNVMEHGLEAWIARWNFKKEKSWAWVEYALKGQFDVLSGKISIVSDCYNSTNFDSTIEIIGDGELLYSSSLLPNMEVTTINVDVSGINTLRISVYDNIAVKGGTSFALWDFAVGKGHLEDNIGKPNFSISGLNINKIYSSFYTFLGDSHVYNMESPNEKLYLELNQISVINEENFTPADFEWKSKDESILRVISSGSSTDVYVNLRVEGIKEGTTTIMATNPMGEEISFDVTVVKPNGLEFRSIYDTKQYYHAGAFYSAASSISDSVEIFVKFENKQIEGYPCNVEEALFQNVPIIEPITLTASVIGAGLSFDRYSYQSTYSATYEAIEFNDGIYDLLMLFPQDTESFSAGSSYTVEVTLESESFDVPVTESYRFYVYDAEKQRVDEHINFINDTEYYKVSKQNLYGKNMLKLKYDGEYQWSKWSSFDFENYYEVVLADMLIGMLDVYQVDTSIVPTILKDWYGTYKSLLGNVTTMVEGSYAEVFDVSEMRIDKVLKVSKYTSIRDGIYAEDDVYQAVLDMFANEENVDEIQTFFSAVDDTESVFSVVKLTGNVVRDFVTWGNSISVLNAFLETDDNFKQIFRDVANNIPASEKKMKEAIGDYLNYAEDFAGQFSEIYDSLNDLTTDITLSTFEGIVGKKLWDFLAVKAVGWIGNISVGGLKLSTTAVYKAITSETGKIIGGSVLTGISLGLCLSDLICDSSDKASEMGKIIAMSEYAPYIIQTLEYYENNLYTTANINSVDLFEKAFSLHQASQSYIIDHTISALEVKAETILQKILGSEDYYRLIADVLVHKNAIENLACCGSMDIDTVIHDIKVIAIKCPVDVYVYDENGSEIVRIFQDKAEYVADGLCVYIRDREKYVALPADQEYSIKITATDTGTMEYVVMEYDENAELYNTIQTSDIPLVKGREFTGEIVPEMNVEENVYDLIYDDKYSVCESIELFQEYVVLNLFDEYGVQLHALVEPKELMHTVQWSMEGNDESVASVDENGLVTANGVGTAYVLACVYDGENGLTARCRIDVTESLTLDGVQLNTAKATTELYSTDYAELELLLQLPQNYAQAMNLRSGNGIAIQEAWFVDEDTAAVFDLVAADDRHLLVVPKEEAIADPGSVQASYESAVTVKVGEKEYTTESVKLTVKKTLPKLKASVENFNSFYSGQAKEIQVTGATVKEIRLNGALPEWLTLENGWLVLTEDAPQKSGNAKVSLLVDTEEWAVPAALTLNVKNAYKAPALKLSASTVTLSGDAQNSVGVPLMLQCKNKKDVLSAMKVTGITAPEGYSVSNFDPETGAFTLKAEEGFRPGKITLAVCFEDTENTLPLKLTVKSGKVSLKLAKSTVTLNAGISDSVSVPVTAAPADYRIGEYTLELLDKSQEGQLTYAYENGCIRVSTTDTTEIGATYRLRFTAAGRSVNLTVKTNDKAPEVTLKASGQVDLSFPEKAAVVTASFKNYSGQISSYTWTVAEMKGKTLLDASAAEKFQIVQNGNTFELRAKDGAQLDIKNSYMLTLKLTLSNGMELPEKTVKFAVKNTSVKLKLSKNKLTLNKLVSDAASVTVTCTTKGYPFTVPTWEVTDSKGIAAPNALNIRYEKGTLTVAPGEGAAYGGTYKVLLKANAFASPVTLTVTVPTEAKSKITGTIKVSGNLDVIRNGSAVTVTPSYKNVTECAEMEEQLLIYSSADKYNQPVNHLFEIQRSDSGAFVITKAEGAALDHTKTYKVQLVTVFNGTVTVESKQLSLKVKMGASKLTVSAEETTLFGKDKHDRVDFTFVSREAALNEAKSVTIKDAKYQDVFEIYDYGNGQFAVGFKDGQVDSKLLGKTVTLTLNVTLDGNESTKVNTTVKLKITVTK